MTAPQIPTPAAANQFFNYAENFITAAQQLSASATATNAGVLQKARENIAAPQLGRLTEHPLVTQNPTIAALSTFNSSANGSAASLDSAFGMNVDYVLPSDAAMTALDVKTLARDHRAALANTSEVLNKWFPGVTDLRTRVQTAFEIVLSRNDLVREYATLNERSAQQITDRLTLQYRRDEERLLDEGTRFNTCRIPGPVYHQVMKLREQLHETIMLALEQLGGEGLQRDYRLAYSLLESQLSARHDALRAFGQWVGQTDQKAYAASQSLDAAMRGGDVDQLRTIAAASARVRSLEFEAIRTAAPAARLANQALVEPASRAVRGLENEMKAFVADANHVAATAAATFARLRGQVSGFGRETLQQRIDATTQ